MSKKTPPKDKPEKPKPILPSNRPDGSIRQDKKDWEPTKPREDKRQ